MRKVRIVLVIGSLVSLALATGLVRAEVGADLRDGHALRHAGKYAEAEQAYLKVMQEADLKKPVEARAAFSANKDLVLTYLARDMRVEAQAAAERLLTYRGLTSQLARGLCQTVEDAKVLGKIGLVEQIYEGILEAQPNHAKGIWLQMGWAAVKAHGQDDRAVDEAIRAMVTRYSKDRGLERAIGQVAETYQTLERPDRVRALYEHVVAHAAALSVEVLWADTGLVQSCIRQKDADGAARGLQRLMDQYAGQDGLPGALNSIAAAYQDARMYDQALRICQAILSTYPASDQCLPALGRMAVSYLAQKDADRAAEAVQALLSRFAANEAAIEPIAEIATGYQRQRQYAQARDLYRFNLEHYPTSNKGIESMLGFINCSISLKDSGSVDAGIDSLLGRFAEDRQFLRVTRRVGRRLREADPQRAVRLLQAAADLHPQDGQAVLARVAVGDIYLRQGQDSQAEAVFQDILTRYKDHEDLAHAVFFIGEAYYDRAVAMEKENAGLVGSKEYARLVREQGRGQAVERDYRRAIEKWRIIIEQLPYTEPYTAHAWYFTGVVHRRHLDEPDKGLACYQKVVQTWPAYEYAWSAQGMMPLCYQGLIKQGKMTKAQAAPLIEQAYQGLVQGYPDSTLAESALLKLGMIQMNKGRWEQAAGHLMEFLGKYPQAPQRPYAMVYLGTTYERRGMPQAAAELYRTCLDMADPGDRKLDVVRARLASEMREVEQ